MKKLKIALFMLSAMFIMTGCGIKNQDALIKINNTVITKSEFDKAFDTVASNNMFSQMGIDVKNNPDDTFALMMREKVVSELIIKSLLADEIKKNKITVSKDDLDKAEQEITGKFGSKEQFIQLLKTNGITYETFKKDLEKEIQLKKYVDSIAMVSIGESEAKKYYEENKDKFKYPERVRASHILIMSNPEQIKEKLKSENKDIKESDLNQQIAKIMNDNLKRAQQTAKEVKKAPASFDKIAKEKSEDPGSALKGGDLGFFSRNDMVEPFAAKAFSMAPNTVSDVVQTQYGYHIIKVTDRSEAGILAFDDCKQDIINYLENQDKVGILKNKIEALRKAAKIEYYDENYNPEVLQKKIKETYNKNPEANASFADQNGQNVQ